MKIKIFVTSMNTNSASLNVEFITWSTQRLLVRLLSTKKGKKLADTKTTAEEIEDLHKLVKKLFKKSSKMKDFREEFLS